MAKEPGESTEGNEFDVIGRYFKDLAADAAQVIKGPGDDCAVLQVAPDHELCVSTDTLIEGVHFPEKISADVVASRTVAANLSDLAAMGASPHSFVLALTMPKVDHQWLEDFSSALKSLMDTYRIPLVGGNLAKGSLSLTMTVMGYVPDGQTIYRSGAQIGDLVFVTGNLGDAGRGLELVQNDQFEGILSERYLRPTPRLEVGESLRGIATSMIDLSDGLIADAAHVAAESKVGLSLHLAKLPVSEALETDLGRDRGLQFALAAGDDYELCFTAPKEAIDQISEISDRCGVTISQIGEVVEQEGVRVIDEQGNPVTAEGYLHFR